MLVLVWAHHFEKRCPSASDPGFLVQQSRSFTIWTLTSLKFRLLPGLPFTLSHLSNSYSSEAQASPSSRSTLRAKEPIHVSSSPWLCTQLSLTARITPLWNQLLTRVCLTHRMVCPTKTGTWLSTLVFLAPEDSRCSRNISAGSYIRIDSKRTRFKRHCV